MTNFTWIARGLEVSALNADAAVLGVMNVNWSSSPEEGSSGFQWSNPSPWPALLIRGIGATITTAAGGVAQRKLRLSVTWPGGATYEWLAFASQISGLSRRWEVGPFGDRATSFGTLSNAIREPIRHGLFLLPSVTPALVISINNFQAGDALTSVAIHGTLLVPA